MNKKDKDDNTAEKNIGEKIIDTAQNVNTANDINQDVVNNEQDAKISELTADLQRTPVLRLLKRSCRYLTISIALLLLTPIRLVLLLKT